ncbi:putative glycoside hydrolase [Phytophthora cinnamomi]|uniref:putative glycoside hydrolase n=1 Tax=Phytophthora cinnamomi TaxID=4785 RepID=UPI00355A0565|nr:putative glycoside hydrolase [Phytophthora cinnamomi]
MKVVRSIVTLATPVTAATWGPQAARADIVPAQPGSELFEQFRPVYHFMARDNWMNDPCAPYYDEDTDLYHLFYQYNPNSSVWGNATWGHAVSKDQVTWEDYPNALHPFGDKWDYLGAFSGSAMGNAIDGKRTVFYTGVTALPIHWTKKYLFGEHVVYATTEDSGKTWQKGSEPLIELPPAGLNVTGWRDPNVFHSASLDTHFGYDTTKGSNYILVAGGIHDVGPRIFLYHSEDYKTWEYKGYLLAQEKNTTFSSYSANWGFNFETTVYREIEDEDGEVHNLMLFAAEGSPNRYPMWATGSFSGGGCGVETDPEAGLFTPLMVGVSDRSDWYANIIYTDKDGKNVLIGWITEDNNFTTGQPQGWDGMLSVPREVDISIVRNIYDVDSHLVGKGDWIVSDSKDMKCADGSAKQSKTIKTLSVKPLSDLQLLRNENAHEQVANVSVKGSSQVLNSTGASFELIAEVPEFERGSKVGFEVRRSSAGDEVTTIVYDDAEKKIIIDRSNSSSATCAVFADNGVKPISESVWGYFYLYDIFTGASKSDVCEAKREKLSFHVFVDVSSVEVFVNDRFSLSARIYPCASQTKSDGIALTASGDATFENVQVWTNPKHAWADKRTVPTF